MNFIIQDYNDEIIDEVEVTDCDSYDELMYYRGQTLALTNTTSHNFDYHYQSYTLRWAYITNLEFSEIIDLIAYQNTYKIYWEKSSSILIRVYFDGDIVYTKDTTNEITNLTLKMVGVV